MNRASKPARVAKQQQQQQKQQPLRKQKRTLTTSPHRKSPRPHQFSLRKFSSQDNKGAVEAVNFQEAPNADAFQSDGDLSDSDPERVTRAVEDADESEGETMGFVKQDNAFSFHPPVFAARPLKVHIANIFDPRADYQGGTRDLQLRLEIGHDGANIGADMDEKAEWMDTHVTNDWLDTCMTRYCVNVSKKAKQQKPSNARQAKARKLHKQTNEKRLASSIRAAIDNTPRFTGFANQLATNKQSYGTYAPTEDDLQFYQASGLAREDFLSKAGKDPQARHKLLRSMRESI